MIHMTSDSIFKEDPFSVNLKENIKINEIFLRIPFFQASSFCTIQSFSLFSFNEISSPWTNRLILRI